MVELSSVNQSQGFQNEKSSKIPLFFVNLCKAAYNL